MIIEKEYIKKVSVAHRKKYAQFFTPEQISDFMASWVISNRKDRMDILEPAFGLGIFSRSMFKLNSQIRVIGYDVDEIIYDYAKNIFEKLGYDVSICNENYLNASWDKKFDGIICNPPYLKFHDYDNKFFVPIVNERLNTNLSGFTNIYTLFILKSIFQMKEGARMAYIVPSEFLNSDYGIEVKKILLQSGVLRHIIIVDFKSCAFDDALTTACIIFCEKQKYLSDIRFSKIDNLTKLEYSLIEYTTYSSEQLNPEVKWKQYYDDTQSLKYSNLVPFSTFAKVSRGIATGANDYFTFNMSKIDIYDIPENLFLRCICHSMDVQSLIFTETDFDKISRENKSVYLFNGCGYENIFQVSNYIKLGEEIGVNKKYLTATRKPWYGVENRPPSPIWVSVFNRSGLRFVRNKAGVYNLTTFHCVYNLEVVDIDILFAYLVTDVAKEIFMDNSRQYGNGLVKFEPNDLNKGNVVDLRILTEEEKAFIFSAIDKLQNCNSLSSQVVVILNDFFKTKYTNGLIDLVDYGDKLDKLLVEKISFSAIEKKNNKRIKQLNFGYIFEQYALDNITENIIAREENALMGYGKSLFKISYVDETKNVLISLVKKDNEKEFFNKSATIYYTGKKFPTTVALNKLYYFMPYIKGKGVRDLWIIKIARLGYRKEGTQEEDRNDLRLVFEIEFVKQLFDDYRIVKLDIWRTFKDTTLSSLLTGD